MVTSAENRRWRGDIGLETDYQNVGLPAPSLIRTEKITVIDAKAAEWRGEIGPALLEQVREKMGRYLRPDRSPATLDRD